MMCLRFTSVALWLLLSLASLRDSIAINHQEIDALASSHHAIELNKKELQVEAEAEVVTRRKIMLRGRKMGAKDEMKKEKITGAINPSVGKCEDINGGKGEYSKLECDLKTQDNFSSMHKLEAFEPENFPNAEQNESSAAKVSPAESTEDELYNLLNEDYTRGHKKSPIHNLQTLKDSDIVGVP
ncbi:uncharacterized protein A4U43_C05F22410 [Asparagus officinalis]|uniref:Uncharacterized protein n=1 Tax=Asparagus officinalis TaxID=4686 RepID=A0A5P1ETM5_ASPOF|nr:uncharacterized protein A4U43_C05F22410 [Asparagus officinalis]